MNAVTKPGKQGTLYLYRIKYRDRGDAGCPTFSTNLWAYDAQHAIRKFNDTDEDWWSIESIDRVQDKG